MILSKLKKKKKMANQRMAAPNVGYLLVVICVNV